MNAKRLISICFAAAVCCSLAACSIKFGFVDDSSSSGSESIGREDNSFIAEILDKGYSSTDMGENYELDGDFSMLELHDLDQMYASRWKALSDDKKHGIALNLLNFWAYYGDDASIRFKPSELTAGITDVLDKSEADTSATEKSVLDAALEYAVPSSTEKYLAIIGVIDLDNVTGEESSSEADTASDVADEN